MNDTAVECPRCAFEAVTRLATSPVPGVWDVLQCGRCLYTWRTIEPARRTRRDAYPEAFRLTEDDIDNAIEVPAVPPLRGHN
ncbi:non-oxidative hydroxyarylic acid decarboxylases subunit D [Streptomyces sp. NPDC056580]|uniref:non-oxidative hydroxyarylic acid decarboxylases subunit D n=1 Tax=Streptomyces sp. NPDC056580 TaxID=3345872 RepID=UPI0036B0D075